MKPEGNNKNSALTNYVIDNIDVAIKKGWIQVYYQPVIRTLTGQLCGAESLARWIDPEVGFLAPDQFISALEDSRQIQKLDCFIVDTVCRHISERMSEGLPTVPVSVNFSRLDFETTDMLKVVEYAVDRYDIPRDSIHIEITESMIASDAELMEKVIEDFRGAGYEVWMDDFGSGYSSLTLLKDYQFDTMKLDMGFLRTFTDRSRAIITSTVTMAKDIGIMTLAEGVETREQVDFLMSVGCGKLQGYYYGKPMPIDAFFDHIEENGIVMEERGWRHYYEVASATARHSDEPLEIIEDDGKEFVTLFMNEPYKKQIFPRTLSSKEADRLIYQTNSPLLKKYREYANTIERTKNVETFYYTNNGNIMKFTGVLIAENSGKYLIKGAIWNISSDSNVTKRNSVDFKLKELNHLFEVVLQINPGRNRVVPLLGKFIYGMDSNAYSTDLNVKTKMFRDNVINPEDKAKYIAFMDFDTITERIEASGKGFIENVFRVKQEDGSYRLKEISVMIIPGTGGKEYLYCMKEIPDNAGDFISGSEKLKISSGEEDPISAESIYARLFKNFAGYSSIMFFWKDAKRRYLGASAAFLKYFGLASVNEIVGKTGNDTNWTIEGVGYDENEMEVLEKGRSIKNAPAQCIIDGVIHNIIYNKAPIYENGEIVGIMGYMIDADIESGRMDALYEIGKIDRSTGLMNAKGFIGALVDYSIQYDDYNRDFGLIIIRNEKYDRIVSTYGSKFADRLSRRIGEILVEGTPANCAVARVKEGEFAVLAYMDDSKKLEALTQDLRQKVEDIRELEGNSVTVKVRSGCNLRSAEGITDVNMYHVIRESLS
ncbi:bifunctional diguanylate cyclase/phosphodiesterase [Butyrivibrio sp. FCS014]|uniref:bifunctional diguanylate cyclase/phosphodiesterase n=1 Tax=Butyrivibrio sp. FCS014 TaxID=1408304 RepID=UPI00046367E6|nr:EAL domain-containing protein [Butyrivibrio sp. FCS014]